MKNSHVRQFVEEMSDKMSLLSKRLMPKLRKKLRAIGMGPAHMHVLAMLSDSQEDPIINEISRNLSISLAMMTRIIDRLEMKKYVARKADPKDRRAIRIRLTTAGKEIFRELKDLQKQEMVKLLNSFNERDKHEFIKAMRTLATILLKYQGKTRR